jgi:hypothetical protein
VAEKARILMLGYAEVQWGVPPGRLLVRPKVLLKTTIESSTLDSQKCPLRKLERSLNRRWNMTNRTKTVLNSIAAVLVTVLGVIAVWILGAA